MIKEAIQRLLKQAGLYHRVKGSCLYDVYWRLADPRMVESRGREVAFYRQLLQGLRAGDWIFDIGANEGYKTDIFLRLGARVLSVDPDRTNQETLHNRFLRHRWVKKPVMIIGKAVSDRRGIHEMWVEEPGCAKNTLSKKWVDTLRHDESRFGHRLQFVEHRKVETISLEELIETYGIPVFVKIDVEGYEPHVLRGLRRAVPYLSFEVNLPEFKEEGIECLDLLAELAGGGQFNYAIDCGQGLILDRWLSIGEFKQVFDSCTAQSLEVFWRSGATSDHSS
jgi:FkbM family methyltransferase